MNWELSRASKHKCPCGQGTYTIRTFLDDWKRSEEQWDMDCPKCRRKYDLCSSTIPKSGKLLRSNRWVKKVDAADDGLSFLRGDMGAGEGAPPNRLAGVKSSGLELPASRTRTLKIR